MNGADCMVAGVQAADEDIVKGRISLDQRHDS